MNELERLGRQLDAIDLAIAEAQAETDPDRRTHLWSIVSRATAAAREDYDAAVEAANRRPRLRLINGGRSTTGAPAGAGIAILAYYARRRPSVTAAAGTALAGAMLGLALLVGQTDPNQVDAHQPPQITGPSARATMPPGPDVRTPAPPPSSWVASPTPHAPVPAAPAAVPAVSLSLPTPSAAMGDPGLTRSLASQSPTPPPGPSPTAAAGSPSTEASPTPSDMCLGVHAHALGASACLSVRG